MKHALWLAVQSLRAAPGRTLTLVAATSVALFLPLFTFTGIEQLETTLLSRARTTPVLIGRKGNEFDLTMAGLYFRGAVRDPVAYGARHTVARYGAATPLYVKHTASGIPIVGTTLGYLGARDLSVAEGRGLAVLGEVVAGATVAREFGLTPGDTVRSDLTNLYNLAGSYPLLLRVVGVLAPSGTPDDEVFFADIKTTWVLDGALHGHEEVTEANALDEEEQGNLEATAAIFMFTEITEKNRGSFHLHGTSDELPATGIVVFPHDTRARDQLLGDLALSETLQAVQPSDVIDTLLDIVFRIRDGLSVALTLVGASTVSFLALVILLSIRLRRRELTLMRRIGASRGTVAAIVGAELALVGLGAATVAIGATGIALSLLASAL